MRIFSKICTIALLLATTATPSWADTVHLKNGSRLEGTIVEMTADELVLDTDFAGRININQDTITGLESIKDWSGRQAEIKRLKIQREQAAVIAAQQEQLRQQAAKHEAELAAVQEQAAVQAQEDENVWSGSIKATFSGSDGNTDKMDFGGKAAAKRETEFDRLYLSVEGHFENDDGVETENEITANAKLERDINDRLYAYGETQFERDKPEEVDLRSNITGGLGYYVIKEEGHEFKPHIGAGYEVTAYTNDPTEKEIIWSAGYDYRVDMFDKLRFTHEFDYLPTFDAPTDDYRLESDAILAYPLNDEKNWNIELGLQHEYDSKPAADVKKLDTYYSVGISRSFD